MPFSKAILSASINNTLIFLFLIKSLALLGKTSSNS